MSQEIEESIEQMNIQQAIIGAPQHALQECLGLWSRGRLSAIAKEYEIEGRSSMAKDEQIQALVETITSMDRLEQSLLLLDGNEWAVFDDAFSVESPQIQLLPYGYYRFLLERGLVFTFFHEGQVLLVMPEEVKEAFSKLNDERFSQERSRISRIFNYLSALTHLYGIFSPETLTEIYNLHYPEDPMSPPHMEKVLMLLLQREQEFVLLAQGYIADSSLVHHGEQGELERLIRQIQGKPRYIPEQAVLLNYKDGDYFEITPQLMALKAYVQDKMDCDEVTADDLIDDIQLNCAMEEPLESLLYEFERRDLVFKQKRQAEEVLDLLKEIKNHTRLWSLCGHTPKELERRQVNSAESKIGRNDPCPCGSGLKYKKCCGK